MKIKEILKFEIEVAKDSNIIYSGISDDASDEIKNSDIKTIVMDKKCLKITI